MNLSCPRKRGGFTLVELLVVIVIVASLAALTFTVGPKMLAKGRATEAMQNLRQFGPLMNTYAADHNMQLPAMEGEEALEDGPAAPEQWNTVLMNLAYPDVALTTLKSKDWWTANKTFMKNPLFKASTYEAPGYAMNAMIVENLAIARDEAPPSVTEALKIKVHLASLDEPSRIPLVAPYIAFNYRFDDVQLKTFSAGTPKALLNDGKFPILFVDGHVETMTPAQYSSSKLNTYPTKTAQSDP